MLFDASSKDIQLDDIDALESDIHPLDFPVDHILRIVDAHGPRTKPQAGLAAAAKAARA